MDMAGSSLAYQAEHKPAPGQAPDELGFLTQIWMNHSNNTDRQNNGAFGALPQSRPNGLSLPSSPAASAAIPPQNTLSASDAILNAGQLRKEPPGRAAGAQSQSGDALLQAFSDLPQQHSLKVNTALLGTANGSRASLDSQRAQSPFWLRPPSQGPVMSQAPQSATSAAATSTGVFLGQQPYTSLNAASNPAPQLYAQQLQGQQRSPLPETLHPKAAAQAAANAARAAAAIQQQRPTGGSASPFWVTTGQAGGANQPVLNTTSAPRFNFQVPNQQLHPLGVNTAQRLPMQLQLNGSANLSARPQAFSAGLANATYIPGTGLQYGGAAPHLQQQRASLPTRASDVSSLQQDPNALAAAAAAAANAAAYKRNAGLPPHVAQQLLRGQQVLPNQAGPRPPNGLLFETNDIDLSGLTPAQLQMLISSPPEQVWRLAAQMGVFKQRKNGQVGPPMRQTTHSGFVNNGSSASQANYINAMAHLHQLHGHHNQNTPQPAAPALGQNLPDGFSQHLNGGLLQQQILRQQQQAQAQAPIANDNGQRVLLELGKTFAGLGITVEAAINAGLLGGLAVADVHTLCEAYAAEVHRMQLTGIQPQPHLAGQVFGNQAAVKPEMTVGDLLARSGMGAGAPATNPAVLAAARQQQALLRNHLQAQTGLSRVPGTPGSDIGHLSGQEAEQLALLRQLQLNGSLQANYGNANAAGSVSSAPGAGFRAPSPLAVGGHRTTSPAFGTSFGAGTVSPAYSTTSLPGGLGLQSRPGSAFGQTGIGGGPIAADPVIRRPSPNPSIASHASKHGSPRKAAPIPNGTSPTSARTFNCATYSFFGSADSRNEHGIESPHSADAIWAARDIAAKDVALVKSQTGSDSAPDGSAHASEHGAPIKQGSDSAGDEAKNSTSSQGQGNLDEDHGVPTDEEILISHLNLGPGF